MLMGKKIKSLGKDRKIWNINQWKEEKNWNSHKEILRPKISDRIIHLPSQKKFLESHPVKMKSFSTSFDIKLDAPVLF